MNQESSSNSSLLKLDLEVSDSLILGTLHISHSFLTLFEGIGMRLKLMLVVEVVRCFIVKMVVSHGRETEEQTMYQAISIS